MEKRKALRIIAGILLIVLAVLRVCALFPSFFALMKIDRKVGAGYWIGFGQSILTAFIGVMILVRGFRTAGVAAVVYAASVIAIAIGSVNASCRHTLIPITTVSTVLFLCAAVFVTVLICIGLFLHDRRSLWMLIVSAVLLPVIPVLFSAASSAQTEYLGSISYAGESLIFVLIIGILKSIPLAVASLLLGLHFGAQARKRENA